MADYKKVLGNLINYIKKSKEGKVLVSNFAYLSLLQIAGYIFPLLTLPYLARVIGAEGFGKIAFAAAIMTWIQTIADWGFNYTATRDVARNRDEIKKVSEIFSNVLWARIFLMIISFLFLIILIISIQKFRDDCLIILVTFLMIPGHIMFPDWFFQAMEKMKYITILNIISKLLFTIAVFVFIHDKSDYILQPLFVSLGFVLSGVISIYFIITRWKIKILRPSFSAIIVTIKNSTDVFINNLMPNFYNSFSSILLGFTGGDIANGKLDAGNKFILVANQFMQVISRVFYPFLSRRIDKHSFYEKFNLLVGFLVSIGLFILAPWLIRYFFTEEFNGSIAVMQILAVSIFFLALSNVYGTNYLIIEGYEKLLRNITMICSVIGMVSAIPLIYYFSYLGAAITITLSRCLLGLLIMFYAKKVSRIKNCK